MTKRCCEQRGVTFVEKLEDGRGGDGVIVKLMSWEHMCVPKIVGMIGWMV